MMPDGASVEELCNITILREYIAKNAESFYDYANNVRGREVENGRLHVVYGVRKGASWGMASFSNTSANSNLRLQFLTPREGADAASSLGWEHTVHHGTAEVKVGPHAEENAGLPGTEDGLGLPTTFGAGRRLGSLDWSPSSGAMDGVVTPVLPAPPVGASVWAKAGPARDKPRAVARIRVLRVMGRSVG